MGDTMPHPPGRPRGTRLSYLSISSNASGGADGERHRGSTTAVHCSVTRVTRRSPSMQRRVIAAIAAVLLAGIGAVLLYSYVNTADKRAMAGQEATSVLVVTKVVPAGTPSESIAPYVE